MSFTSGGAWLLTILLRIVAAECRNPWVVIFPTLSALQVARSRKLNARFENGSPEYPANTNSNPTKAILQEP
jgi:hypothetical protein